MVVDHIAGDEAPVGEDSVVDESPVVLGLGNGADNGVRALRINMPPGRRCVEIRDRLTNRVEYDGGSDTGADSHGAPGKQAVMDGCVLTADFLVSQRREADYQSDDNHQDGADHDKPAQTVCTGRKQDAHGTYEGVVEQETKEDYAQKYY